MPNQSQQSNKSAAALAFATMLSEQLLRQQNPENPMQGMDEAMQEPSQTLETALGSEEAPEMDNMPMDEETLDLEENKPEEHEEDMEKDMEAKMEKMMDEKMTKMEERMDKMMVEMMSKMNERGETK